MTHQKNMIRSLIIQGHLIMIRVREIKLNMKTFNLIILRMRHARRIHLRIILLNTSIVSKVGRPQIIPLEKTHTSADHLKATHTYLVLKSLIQMMIRLSSRG